MTSERSALIVAVEKYEDTKLRKLRTPSRDAEELKRVLGNPAIGDFRVELCANEPEHVMRRKIAKFFADRRRDDLLLLHIACHGLKDDFGHLYFAASDTEVEHLDSTAVAAEFVNRQMTNSRSRRIVLLLDCCYSGAFARGMAARAGEGVEVRERFEGSGRAVLTASSAMEYAFEGEVLSGEGNPSVFTSAVIKALETGEADRDGDRWISVDELYDYVYDQVQEVTPKQTPSKWIFDVRGDLLIAKSSYVAPVHQAELAPDLRRAIESPLPEIRLAAVQLMGNLLGRGDANVATAAREALERLAAEDDSRVSQAAISLLRRAASIDAATGQEGDEGKSGEQRAVSTETGFGSAEAATRPAETRRDPIQPTRPPSLGEPAERAGPRSPPVQPEPGDPEPVSPDARPDQNDLPGSAEDQSTRSKLATHEPAGAGPPRRPPTTAERSAADRATGPAGIGRDEPVPGPERATTRHGERGHPTNTPPRPNRAAGSPSSIPLPKPRKLRPGRIGLVALGALLVVSPLVAIILLTGGEAKHSRDPSAVGSGEMPTQVGNGKPIQVGDDPRSVAVGEGTVWVASSGRTAEGTVWRIDPRSNRVVGKPIKVGGIVAGLAVGEGAVWVARGHAVSRIDPRSNRVIGEIKVPNVTELRGVAVGAGAVWVINSGSRYSVAKIDPRLNAIVAEFDVGEADPEGAAVGEGAVWVAGGDTVSRINPRSNRVIREIEGPGYFFSVAVGEDAIWAGSDDTISRIDPRSNQLVGNVTLEATTKAVAVGNGAVWVTNPGDDAVSRIDPRSTRLLGNVKVGDAPQGVAVGQGAVWVANSGSATVTRIDPRPN